MKQSLKTCLNELRCCEYEIEIERSENIPNNKRKFLDTLKKNYTIMSDKIHANIPSIKDISEIKNYISPENIHSHIKKKYEPIIKTIFTEYISFLQNLLEDIKKEKIPFYNLIPIARNFNEQISHTCEGATSKQNCHLLFSVHCLARIKLPLGELQSILKDNFGYLGELNEYVSALNNKLKNQIEIINYIKKDTELHNYEQSYTCSYNKKMYGNINIHDNRMCPKNIKNPKDCKPPCEYHKKTKQCYIAY